MWKRVKQNIGIVCVLAVIVLVIPGLINKLIINNDIYSKASNDGWVSFLGSYLGGILGGLATLLGVLISLKISRKESIKPYLIIDINEEMAPVREPEHYSDLNSIIEIKNYYEIPQIANVFNMKLINTGKGSAKEISIKFSIRKDDVLITDSNRMMMSLISPLNKVDENAFLFMQNYRYSFLGGDGNTKPFPLNQVMNAIIISSLWNMENFIYFTEDNFLHSLDDYHVKTSKLPLTIPKVFVDLVYSDVDDNKYSESFILAFDYVYQQLGSYTVIKPRLDFDYNEIKTVQILSIKSSKAVKKQKKESFSSEDENILSLKGFWSDEIIKFGQYLGFDENISKQMSKDEALERAFFNVYKLKNSNIKIFIYEIAFIYCDLSGELLKIDDVVIDAIYNLYYSLFDLMGPIKKNKLFELHNKCNFDAKEIIDIINDITNNKNELQKYHFMSYENLEPEENTIIEITKDGDDSLRFDVNIGNRKLKTELGFYRKGYTYRLNEDDGGYVIQSVAKRLTDNSEFGFLDYSGYSIGSKKDDWECTYMR